jgi:hypothetical protein
MIRQIIENSHGHPLKNQKILLPSDYPCDACSQGKLIIKPSPSKVIVESSSFLQRIQGDICGPIHPPCGPFRYFMVLIDASTRWSHVCLLSTRNIAFVRLIAQIIRLRAQFPDYPIQTIRMDNAGEFTSQAFYDYCLSIGINVEHPVAHTHTQNGLAESFIKRLQLIARPLLMKSKLPVSAWGHAILHAGSLVGSDQQLIKNIPLCNLHLVSHQTFLIFVFLVVLCMFQLRHLNALRWDLNVDLKFMLVLILLLSLDILSL